MSNLMRHLIVYPEGYLYEAIRSWCRANPNRAFTKKGKAERRAKRLEIKERIEYWVNQYYNPMFENYEWEVIERKVQSGTGGLEYYLLFTLKQEFLS